MLVWLLIFLLLPTSAGEEVIFPDPNLEAAVREALGKEEGPLTDSDLERLVVLDASGREIQDLRGIERCVNLEELFLSRNRITDISPLKRLSKLKTLYLDENRIRDISPLTKLTDLRVLKLGSNQITDISPLSNLTRLEQLFLGCNNISDISPLSKLTRLWNLYLSTNQITDVSPLSNLINLLWLGLDHNNISDLRPLSKLVKLRGLDLRSNQISDITPLSSLANLERLNLGSNQIKEIGPLSKLTNLKWLVLTDNQIEDIGPLSNLVNLEFLEALNNRIEVVDPLSSFINLQELRLSNNRIADIDPISTLKDLRVLCLDNNQIRDISPLSNLTKIGDKWSYVPEREGIKVHLGLSNNMIEDITPLLKNPGIGEGDGIDLRMNPLNEKAYTSVIPALKRRGVNLLFDPKPLLTSAVVEVSPQRLEGIKGEELSIDITIKSVENLAGFQITLSFDPQILEFIAAVEGDFLRSGKEGETFWKEIPEKGKITLVCVRTTKGGVFGEAKLFSVSFKGMREGKSSIKLDALLSSPWGEEIPCTVKGGIIVILHYPWDVNGDGVVDLFDLVIVGQHFGETPPSESRVDVNKDGTVNILDLVLIGQHFGERYISGAPDLQLMDRSIYYLSELRRLYDLIKPYTGDGVEKLKDLLRRLIQQLEPARTALLQNYPNPFNPDTWIPFLLSEDSDVSIRIYDLSGRLIRRFNLGRLRAGCYVSRERAVRWDGRNEVGEFVSSGVYIIELIAGRKRFVRKAIIAR